MPVSKPVDKAVRGKAKVLPLQDVVERHPDGWERFEKAVDVALKTKPKRRAPTKKQIGVKPIS
jgi:hypothetical protein